MGSVSPALKTPLASSCPPPRQSSEGEGAAPSASPKAWFGFWEKPQITHLPLWFWLQPGFSLPSLFLHPTQLTDPCLALSILRRTPGMALQDVCKWQAPDTQETSPRLPQAGSWAVPRGWDPQAFLQTHGPRLAHGTTTLAFRFRHGVIAAADTRSSCGNYVACPASRKVIPVHQHLLGTTSGTSADCVTWYRVLQRELRLRALREGQLPSVAGAAKLLSVMMSRYRGLDLCVATALCGWDRSGPALFYVYSDGTCLQGDIFSVGSGSPYAYGVLDRGYRYDMSTQEAYALARRAVAHATRRDAYSGGSVDLFHVRESGWEYVSCQDAWVLYSELQKLPEPEKEREEEATPNRAGESREPSVGLAPGDLKVPTERL